MEILRDATKPIDMPVAFVQGYARELAQRVKDAAYIDFEWAKKEPSFVLRSLKFAYLGIKTELLLLPAEAAMYLAADCWGWHFNIWQVAEKAKSMSSEMYNLCIRAPIFEEIFFRGMLQPVLLFGAHAIFDKKGKEVSKESKIFAIGTQALVFGAVHGCFAQKMGAWFGGLFLGYMAQESDGNLATSMAAHALWNTLAGLGIDPIEFFCEVMDCVC